MTRDQNEDTATPSEQRGSNDRPSPDRQPAQTPDDQYGDQGDRATDTGPQEIQRPSTGERPGQQAPGDRQRGDPGGADPQRGAAPRQQGQPRQEAARSGRGPGDRRADQHPPSQRIRGQQAESPGQQTETAGQQPGMQRQRTGTQGQRADSQGPPPGTGGQRPGVQGDEGFRSERQQTRGEPARGRHQPRGRRQPRGDQNGGTPRQGGGRTQGLQRQGGQPSQQGQTRQEPRRRTDRSRQQRPTGQQGRGGRQGVDQRQQAPGGRTQEREQPPVAPGRQSTRMGRQTEPQAYDERARRTGRDARGRSGGLRGTGTGSDVMQSLSIGEVARGEVCTAEREESIESIVGMMAEKNVGSVVIVEDGSPVGIVTDREIALALQSTPDVVEHTADDLIEEDLEVATTDMDAFDVLDAMREKSVRRIPVVDDDGELVGIVTLDDVLVFLGENLNTVSDTIREQFPDV